MNELQFKKSVELFKVLGEMKVHSKSDIRSELRLGQEISLWDVMATYMVLYRFPLLFNSSSYSLYNRLKHFLWPFRGLIKRLRDSLVSRPPKNINNCMNCSNSNSIVLFLGFTPTFYRDVLHPVAKLLTTRHNIQVVVIGDNQENLTGDVSNDLLRFHSIWDHWNDDVKYESKIMLGQLKRLYDPLLSKIELITINQGVKTKSMITLLRHEFKWLFWYELRRLISQFSIAKHILEKHRPILIVSADDADQRCRIYSLLANEKNIPTVLVQQGLTRKTYPEWIFFSHKIVAAMGEGSREEIISQGVLDEQVVVTGHPGFDRLIVQEPDLYAHIKAKLGVKHGQKMVLFASQPHFVGVFNSPQIRKLMIKAVLNSANSFQNIKLIIKPHPSENIRELKRLLGKSNEVIIVDKTLDISLLIKACDVLITFFSTSALEALYAGKPVINVEFADSGGNRIFSESGATWVARSQNEIATLLKIFSNENIKEEIAKKETKRQHFIHKSAHFPDGRATERVVDVLLGLLSKKEQKFQ